MPPFEQLAVEHPRLRRAVLASAATALLVFAVLTDGDWGLGDGAIVFLTVAAGAAGAAASARVDALVVASSRQRARRWARLAASIGALGGLAVAFVLARSGHAATVSLVAAFLAGFLGAAIFLYPIRSRRDDNSDIANPSSRGQTACP